MLLVKHGARISFVHVASVASGGEKNATVTKFALNCRLQSRSSTPGLGEWSAVYLPCHRKDDSRPLQNCTCTHTQQAEGRQSCSARPLESRGRGETTIRPIKKIMQRAFATSVRSLLPRDFFPRKANKRKHLRRSSTLSHMVTHVHLEMRGGLEEVHIFASHSLLSLSLLH